MKLNCELLPSRDNPSAAVSLAAGVLTITAEPGGSIVSVSGSPAAVTVSDQTGPLGTFADVASVRFNGSAGNDAFVNDTALPSLALGVGGSDYFYGGSGADFFIGSPGGNVFVEASPSADVMIGGAGNDFFLCYGGNDKIFTGKGFNFVYAPAGVQEVDASYGFGVVFKAGGSVVNLNPGIRVIDL